MTTTTVNHLAAARAAMTPTERRLFFALAEGLGHTPAGLVSDSGAVAAMQRTAQILARHVRDDLDEQLAELLYDAGHDGCDDECTGGGRLWYERTARRLTDPYGPLAEVADERERQDDRWGEQNHDDGTGGKYDVILRDAARNACQREAEAGHPTWRSILFEEVTEAFAETDPAKLRAELVQVAAVAAAWIEAMDRRAGYGVPGYYTDPWTRRIDKRRAEQADGGQS
jgi:hypothetical protein